MSRCRHIDVRLELTPDEVLHYYHGRVAAVVAQSLDGRTVRFPANILTRLVTTDGVHGVFRLTFDEDNRLTDLVPLEREPAARRPADHFDSGG
jgi:hypothetical protein